MCLLYISWSSPEYYHQYIPLVAKITISVRKFQPYSLQPTSSFWEEGKTIDWDTTFVLKYCSIREFLNIVLYRLDLSS